jgi:hypothetical protein
MRLEINLAMRTQIRRLKNCKQKTYDLFDFFELWQNEVNAKFWPHELNATLPKKSNQRKEFLSKKHFLLIIRTYLRIYFEDLFLKYRDQYFFLGGKMQLAIIKARIKSDNDVVAKKALFTMSDTTGLVWYLRPSQRHYYMVNIYKHKGLSIIREIQKKALENNVLEKIPNLRSLKKLLKKNKQHYRCIQK